MATEPAANGFVENTEKTELKEYLKDVSFQWNYIHVIYCKVEQWHYRGTIIVIIVKKQQGMNNAKCDVTK